LYVTFVNKTTWQFFTRSEVEAEVEAEEVGEEALAGATSLEVVAMGLVTREEDTLRIQIAEATHRRVLARPAE
jgi:hypothetical protein